MSKDCNRDSKLIRNIVIDDNVLPPVYIINSNNKKIYILILSLMVMFLSVSGAFLFAKKDKVPTVNDVALQSIDILSYDATKNIVELSVQPSSKQEECFFDVEGKERVFGKIVDGKCVLNVSMDSGDITFINEYELSSKSFELNDYVVAVNEKTNIIYL